MRSASYTGNPETAFFMQSGKRFRKIGFQLGNGARFFRKADVFLRSRKRQRRRQLLQYVRLVRFIGMKLETEIAQAEPIETFFDDGRAACFSATKSTRLPVV